MERGEVCQAGDVRRNVGRYGEIGAVCRRQVRIYSNVPQNGERIEIT